METLIKADIFFFISSVATIVLTILSSILLFYLIKAGKNLYALSDALKGGLKESEKFALELKDRLEDNLVFRLFFPPLRRKRRVEMEDDSKKKKS
jgi:hypothetical protein